MEYRNILVPLDGSSFAEHAVSFAATLAERANACVRLLSVEPRLLVATMHEEVPPHLARAHADNCARMKLYLQAIEERIRGPRQVRTTSHVVDGQPIDSILEAIEDLSIDLVVMTTHARGGVKRAWLGSVADDLVRRCAVPVVLLKPDEDAEPDLLAHADIASVLVPLDGSGFAEAALEPAGAFARVHRATITLLQVLPTPAHILAGPVPYGVVDHVEYVNRTAAAEKYLHRTAEALRAAGIEAASVVTHRDDVADAIIDHAAGENAGIIAIATHGRGGLARLVIGSVADRVLRSASCPVIAVRPAAISAPDVSGRERDAVPAG